MIYVQRRKIEFFFARSSAAGKIWKKPLFNPQKHAELAFRIYLKWEMKGEVERGICFPKGLSFASLTAHHRVTGLSATSRGLDDKGDATTHNSTSDVRRSHCTSGDCRSRKNLK